MKALAPSCYLKSYPSAQGDKVLLYSTLHGSKLTVSKSLAEAITSGTVPEAHVETLQRLGILVPDRERERQQMMELLQELDRRNTLFCAVVTLNLDCNLACSYCYESPFRCSSYMTEETADLVVQALLNHPLAASRDLRVEFYGGEALLSVPLMRRISTQLKSAVEARGKAYSFSIVTNGTLLNRRTVEELLPLGLSSAKVTLDGPPRIHDQQRPFTSGRGSFAAILANLKEICALLPIQLGGNFSQEKYREFPELLDILVQEGISPESIAAVQFTAIAPKADEAGLPEFTAGCACSSEPWLMEASLYLREETLKRGFRVQKPKLSACMVESENNMVIGYDGGIYKCPAFMGWQDLRIGTLTEGVQEYAESHGVGAWKQEECLDCAYLPICFGGCKYLQRLNTGSVAGVDCRKELLDATLEKTLRQDLAAGR
ncbi:geopeptide radical SAM maturase [Geomonas sp. RF6]|uniref:geopeptide radical SAM maturase n=1 Tax=Geomonas sp. RF6 TaxID=2897342 RepID=UPI001E635614|nr:geopeptide radical SAM maturase [Geomonas sp. RF6]UFS71935.1 geopeptide radical SAM maturase [Geomonas sp. RF6]